MIAEQYPDVEKLFDEWLHEHDGSAEFGRWAYHNLDGERLHRVVALSKLPREQRAAILSLRRSPPRGRIGRLVNSSGLAWAASLILATCAFAYVAWDRSHDAEVARQNAAEQQELKEEAQAANERLTGLHLTFARKLKNAADSEHWASMVNRIVMTRQSDDSDPDAVDPDTARHLARTRTESWMKMMSAVYGENADLRQIHQALKELEANGY